MSFAVFLYPLGAGESTPIGATPPALMDIVVQALWDCLVFLGPCGDVAVRPLLWACMEPLWGPLTLLFAIVGIYGDVIGPWGLLTLLFAIVGIYGDVIGP